MKGLEFPIVGTKVSGVSKVFDLADPKVRKLYFEAKAGSEIEKVRAHLNAGGIFMGFFLGKKNSGKGTYSSLLREVFGADKIAFVGIGDLVREVHKNWDEYIKTPEFLQAKKVYRGYISFEDAVERLRGRGTSSLLPTEFILAVLKARLNKLGRKAVFVDGLPRDTDQISYSLFFRDLANYRDDPDFFVMIDIPMSVIDERIKYRVVCPKCNNSRNLKLLVTKDVRYDPKTEGYYLICDNPDCHEVRMVPKEGDDVGIAPIRARLDKDEEILKKVFGLHGMGKVLLRNHVPVSEAREYFDDYELTPEYVLEHDGTGKVSVFEKPWTILDDNGVESHSLMAPAVAVSLIKQLPDILGL